MTVTTKEKISIATRNEPPAAHRPWWRIGAETVLISALAIASLECFFNIVGIGQQEFFEADETLGTRHIPSKQVTWRLEGLSRDSFNAFGMRDVERQIAKPQGVKRVAVLGDSAVEGLQVPLADTFPRVLERILNEKGQSTRYEVLNFGCAGYGTGQEVVQYERQISRFKPDVVVLFFNQGDAGESVVLSHQRKSADARPYFYLDEAGNLEEDWSIMAANQHKLKPNPVLDWLKRNSRIYGVYSQTHFSLSIGDAKYVKLKKWWTEKEKSFAPRTARVPEPKYPDQNPVRVAEKLIERLGDDVKKDGGKLVLTMFPNTLKYSDLFILSYRLKKLADARGYAYLDLTDAFVSHPTPNDLYVSAHFSEKGHKLTAEKLESLVR